MYLARQNDHSMQQEARQRFKFKTVHWRVSEKNTEDVEPKLGTALDKIVKATALPPCQSFFSISVRLLPRQGPYLGEIKAILRLPNVECS